MNITYFSLDALDKKKTREGLKQLSPVLVPSSSAHQLDNPKAR
jgi:hypothetical protein